MSPSVVVIDVSDPPEVWERLGFTVSDSEALVGRIRFRLGASPGAGILGWTVAFDDAGDGFSDGPGGDALAPAASIDGLPTRLGAPPSSSAPGGPHPNAVTTLDHLVVRTPDFGRTLEALAERGLDPRRVRPPDRIRPVQMAFFRLGETILELVGPVEVAEATSAEPARFSGLAFTTSDMDLTAACLGDLLRRPHPAVQPGRLIATVDSSAGSAVPIAFLTPSTR